MQDKRKPQGNKTGELSSNDMRQAVLHLADSQGWEYSLSTTGELIPSLCPICLGGDNADRRSFAINLITGLSCCKRGSCGWEGNFSGLQKKLGLEPSETVDVTSSLTKSAMKELKRKAFVKPTITLLPPTREIIDYFAGRKISEATLKAFDISTTDGTRAGEIVFPFYFDNKKELIFVKYRKPKKWFKGCGWDKETREPNTMSILFGMNHCEFGKPLTITEGMLDSLSLYEAGIRNVVSVPSGAMDFNWIEHCWDWLENFSEIIIFGDNDQPGQEMVEALLRRLSGFTCRVVNDYPLRPDGDTPCKDANEVLYFHGDLAIWDMLDSAEGTPLKGVINLSDITPIDPTTVPRIKTNIATVDKTIGGIQAGTVTIFTGLSGSGKSTVTGQFVLSAIEQGEKVCVYSGELGPEDVQAWLNFQAAGSEYITLKYDPIAGGDVPYLSPQIQSRIRDWYNGKLYLFDDSQFENENQLESILSVFKMMARRIGAKLFLVDNVLTVTAEDDEEFRAQGRLIVALKHFAKKYGVAVLVVAHPRKKSTNGAHSAIMQDDVGGNGALVRLADNVIVVERPNLRIIKNRKTGVNKLVECVYCPDSRRIYEKSIGDRNHFSWDKKGIELPAVRADSIDEYREYFTTDNTPF